MSHPPRDKTIKKRTEYRIPSRVLLVKTYDTILSRYYKYRSGVECTQCVGLSFLYNNVPSEAGQHEQIQIFEIMFW